MLEVSRCSDRRNSLRSGGGQGCVDRRAGLGVRGQKLEKDSPALSLECVSSCDCTSADGQGLGAELSELQKWSPARLVGFAWADLSLRLGAPGAHLSGRSAVLEGQPLASTPSVLGTGSKPTLVLFRHRDPSCFPLGSLLEWIPVFQDTWPLASLSALWFLLLSHSLLCWVLSPRQSFKH